MGFIDPHGDVAEELLDCIPSHRIDGVAYFNPADLEYRLGGLSSTLGYEGKTPALGGRGVAAACIAPARARLLGLLRRPDSGTYLV